MSSEGGILLPSKDMVEQNVALFSHNHPTDTLPLPLNATVLSHPVKGWAAIRPSHVAHSSFAPVDERLKNKCLSHSVPVKKRNLLVVHFRPHAADTSIMYTYNAISGNGIMTTPG